MLSPTIRLSISLCVSVFPCLMPARSASLLFLLNMFPLTYFIAHRRLAKIRIKSSTNKKAIPFCNEDTALIANINAAFCVVPLRNHSTGGSYPKPALNKIFLWSTIEWRGVRRLSYPRRIAHCSKKLQKGRSSNIILFLPYQTNLLKHQSKLTILKHNLSLLAFDLIPNNPEKSILPINT